MKKAISIVLASLIVLPLVCLSGCGTCNDNYGKVRQESGGK